MQRRVDQDTKQNVRHGRDWQQGEGLGQEGGGPRAPAR
jgi:hypothetical protein